MDKQQIPEGWEWTKCLLCGADQPVLLYILADYNYGYPGRFSLVRCQECGLVYLNPRPTAQIIDVFYPSVYEPHSSEHLKNLTWLKKWRVRYGLNKRCRFLIKEQSHGKVLDIGCGSGDFVAAMVEYGWQAVGIDFSWQAVRSARHALRLDTVMGRGEKLSFASSTFDAVTMWDSLEHFHIPNGVICEVYRILKPGGRLLIRVPLLDSLDAQFFGVCWAGLDVPRHLSIFSRRTLAQMLDKAGFSIDYSGCMSGSYASFILSLRFLLTYHKLIPGLGEWLLKVVNSSLVSILGAPYFKLLDKLILGPEGTILARKGND